MTGPTRYDIDSERQRRWLASLLMRRESQVWPRYARLIERLARRPRGWRQHWQRRLAATATGMALLLALAGFGARAAPDNVITVASGEVVIANNGKCSLSEAIITANDTYDGQPFYDCAAGNYNGADTIVLPAGSTFTITGASNSNEKYGATGLPWIESTVIIEGNGATIQRPDSAGDFRLLAVDSSGDVSLKNVTLSGGYAYLYRPYSYGGTYYYYAGMGGGILNMGRLALSDATIRDNTAYSYYDQGQGGGIANLGTLSISGSAIVGNNATGQYGGGGGGVWSDDTLTILSSTISGNRVTGEYTSGGGIRNFGYLKIDGTQVIYNAAAGYSAWGGGISNSFDVVISNSTIAHNTAGSGLDSYGYAYGGGIDNRSWLEMANTTVSGNVVGRGTGGGITNRDQATITNSTVTGNSNDGIDAGCISAYDKQQTIVRRSIVSGNSGYNIDAQDPMINYNGCNPVVTLDSHNLIGHFGNANSRGVAPGGSDIVPSAGLGAILNALGANGGPTWTHALPPGSPAIDRAPSSACSAAPVRGVDQRGQPRNQNGNGIPSNNECDIGAFEFQPLVPPDTQTPTATATRPATLTPTPTRTPGGPTATRPSSGQHVAFLPAMFDIPYVPPPPCFSGPSELEDNDTPGTANGPLCRGAVITGRREDRADYFTFDAAAAGRILVEVIRHPSPTVQLILTIGDTIVAFDTNPAGGLIIDYPNAPPGRHTILVYDDQPDANDFRRYTLEVSFP